LIHVLILQIPEIDEQPDKDQQREIQIGKEYPRDVVETVERGEIRELVGQEGDLRVEITSKLESVQKHRNRRRHGAEYQEQIDVILLLLRDSIQEANVVQVEANVMLCPDVEDLRDVSHDDEENSVFLSLVLGRVLQRVTDPSFGPKEPRSVREEYEGILKYHSRAKERVELIVVVDPLEQQEHREERVLGDESIGEDSFVSEVTSILCLLWKESEGVYGSDGLNETG